VVPSGVMFVRAVIPPGGRLSRTARICNEPVVSIKAGRAVGAALLLAALAAPAASHGAASGDRLYYFLDERGVPHFSNVPADARYRPLPDGGSTAPHAPPPLNLDRPAEADPSGTPPVFTPEPDPLEDNDAPEESPQEDSDPPESDEAAPAPGPPPAQQ
jgi:hypothetical protein